MHKLGHVIAAALLGLLTACQPLAPESETTGRIVHIVDGDTVEVVIDGATERIRILGIDAPEHGDCGAREATNRLIELAAGATVSVTEDPVSDRRDRFDRILAYLGADETPDIGLQLIEEGLVAAWWPASEPRPTRGRDYEVAEQAARESGQGSWGACESVGRRN